MNINTYEKWFAEYTTNIRNHIFITLDAGEEYTPWGWPVSGIPAVLDEFDIKIEHSQIVRNLSANIAKNLKLPDKDVNLAEIIGLCHDLGRFRQAINFGTMDDRITGSHGEMSADIFLHDTPNEAAVQPKADNFDVNENISLSVNKNVVADALRYHNHFCLPNSLNERSLFFLKLIRDADKLDIFRFIIV